MNKTLLPRESQKLNSMPYLDKIIKGGRIHCNITSQVPIHKASKGIFF